MHKIEKIFVNNFIWNLFYTRFVVLRFLESINDNPKNILEIGCGAGYTTKAIKKRFPDAKIIAIDYDEEEINIANRVHGNLENVKFLQGNAVKLKFKSNSFDAAFEFGVLHHIKDYGKAIKEVNRVLKKNKNFYIFDVSKYFFISLFKKLFPAEIYFTKEEVIKKLKENNFEVKKHKGKRLFSIIAKKQNNSF